MPDYGPAEAKSWGATVIGARPFLIAYNIYLNSDNANIADQIARNVRFVGGGLRFVQAKGFLVEGQAQVSMNLTNFAKTPIYRVQEMVRREAALLWPDHYQGRTDWHDTAKGIDRCRQVLPAAERYGGWADIGA